MLNDQVIGLLQNNAGNPDIVRRIAEENQLSQAEIAQALRIPEGSAARYVSERNPDQGMEEARIDDSMASKPPVGPSGGVAEKPQMATQIPFAPGGASSGSAGGGMASVGGGMASGSTGGGLSSGSVGGGMSSGSAGSAGAPSIAGSAANAMTAGSAGGGMQMGSAGGMGAGAMQAQTAGIPAAPSIGSRPADMGMIKPDMGTTKPAKMPADMKPQGLEQLRGRLRRPDMTEGEEAFVSAFNRLRGVRE